MILYNIRVAFRRLSRQKIHTSLHVLGLTLGITVCLLIGLFIKHELSFDSYHGNADRTYRINTIWTDAGIKHRHYSTPFPLAQTLRKEISGLKYVTHVHHPWGSIIEIDETKRFKQDHIMITDADYLNVFNVKVLKGNAYTALRKPHHAVLSASTAKKFFGREEPLGKTFKYNNSYIITVAAIIEDAPGNTHLPASVILSISTDENFLQTSLTHFGSVSGGSTFVLLSDKTAPAAVEASLKSLYDRLLNSDSRNPADSRADLVLQPLKDVHFNTEFSGGGEWVKAINKSWLWFFAAVGIAVLALACINFINLSTAQAIIRAKEIGVRKSIGAGRLQLIRQFLGEAGLLVMIAGILAMIGTRYCLPFINQLTEKKIALNFLNSPSVVAAIVTGLATTTLLAGLYPAWIITRFRPVLVLKAGPVSGDHHSGILRKALVVAQFSISIGLLIALLVIGMQMNFLRNKNLGFEKENIVILPIPFGSKKDVFTSDLSKIPAITDFSFSTSPPSGSGHWGTMMSLTDRNDPARQLVTTIYADERYPSLYGLQLKEGRFFNVTDTSAVSVTVPEGQRFPKAVVNEKLVKSLGFDSNKAALGKRFWIGMNGWRAEITGVIADFNMSSLHEQIKPTLITQYPHGYDKVNIKVTGNPSPTLSQIESAWKKSFPDGVFEFNFLDDQLDAQYKAEERLFILFKIFSGLAMLISCLGLWGLATFAAQKRTKEIGIRKVLGASVSNITTMLSKDFVTLVAIAILIASPLAYFGMYKWLQDFAFRVKIEWWVFVIAGVSALVIALVTVSFQSIKAAMSNPVKSLRTE